MKVILVSQDQSLYELCRTVLRQLSVEGLSLESPGSKHGTANLTIWDLSSGPLSDLGDLTGESGDLFVVSRKSLSEIQKLLPAGAFGLLLKPVTRPLLTAFLSAALNRFSNSTGHENDGTKTVRADRDELLQALFEANVRLQECDQDRTNFLARALHDYKAPLTALHGYCEMLIRQSAGPLEQDQIDLLQRMQHSIGRLSKMSKAMFELSVHHNLERKPNLIKSNIDNCIQNAVHQIMPAAQEKGIAVTVDLDPPDTCLHMDPAAIEQVIVNLLENACKFTPRNGSIDVRGRLWSWQRQRYSSGGEPVEYGTTPAYKVELQDSGMGILPEHLDSVFEEFTSYAGARDRSGGGLGLAICKMLIAAHRGAIWAESDRQGTTMSFVLPMQPEPVLSQIPVPGEHTELSGVAI
jgi:signal transduction histidine kinase